MKDGSSGREKVGAPPEMPHWSEWRGRPAREC